MTNDGELLQRACERINDLDVPAFIKDGALRYVAVNDAFARLHGAERNQFPGRLSQEFGLRVEDEECHDRQRRALVFGSDEIACVRDRSGRRLHDIRIERFISENDKAYLFAVFEQDKTQAVAATEAGSGLRDFSDAGVNLQMLGSALDLLDAGIGIFSETNKLLYFNDELANYYRSLGFELSIGRELRDVLEGIYDHHNKVDQAQQDAVDARREWVDGRMEILSRQHWQATEPLPDGRWLRSVNKRLNNGWLIILRLDVTEFKVQEMRLGKKIEEAEIYRAAFEDLPVAVFLRDSQRRLVYANAAYEVMLGDKRERYLGQTEEEMFPGPSARFRAENEKVLAEGGSIEKAEEVPFLDGRSISAITRLGRISSPAGEPYIVGSITDVTLVRDAQREAERLHAELQSILEALPVGVAIFDRDLRIEYANRMLNEFWRLEGEEYRNWSGETYRSFLQFNFDRGAYVHEGVDFETLYERRVALWRDTGPFKPFELSNIDGRCILVDRAHVADGKILISCVDITGIRKHQQEVQEAREALDRHALMMHEATSAMSQGLMVLRNDTVFFANDALIDMLEVPADTLEQGKDWLEAFNYQAERGDFGTPENAERIRSQLLGQNEKRKPLKLSICIGGRRWVDIEGKLSGSSNTLVVFTDVTEVRQRERELERLLKRAEAADRAKSEFLANMSHEIRTPMNGVLGMAELLSKSNLDTRQKTFTDIIMKSGNALLTIINDILDFSKIDAGQMSLRQAPFDPVDAIEDVASLLSSSAAEKDIELIVRGADVHHMVLGDAGRFRQIITNLIGNSIKFTERGHVFIDIQSELRGDRELDLTIRIEDTGIGIPADQLERIFEKFSQVDGSSTRRHEGTGLGLAITSGLVDLFGGRMAVESEIGKGSVFTVSVTLPIARQRLPNDQIAHSVQGARVLVVDDNEVNRRILTEQLRLWGFDCVAVDNGRDGIAVLRAAADLGVSVDALILDYQMPEMNGFAVAKLIREDSVLGDLPIIFLTSMDTASSEGAFDTLNIQAHLMKPARSHLLRTTVVEVIRSGRAQLREMARPSLFVGPAEPQPVQEVQSSAADPQREGGGLDVLVAEDNEVNQIVFTQILQGMGVDFKLVSNGAEAVEAWRRNRPNLILMDVSMPVMNGHQAARRIREIERDEGGHVPIIGITAHALESDRDLCLAAGMDDYLSKPISPEILEAKIAEWRKVPPAVEASRS
ncbi:response regulator [Rhizobium sp. SL86]|uniref:response regulator n=1 Tax=Rhizobium sp. SL86 TaxID=2995148 RepID=UPI002276547C|nr:response regulator [Rhizobium sp. SL86]MCY1668082.1 response regulator [Rhizobium sp. SL86]